MSIVGLTLTLVFCVLERGCLLVNLEMSGQTLRSGALAL